jgi:hypothetical protein
MGGTMRRAPQHAGPNSRVARTNQALFAVGAVCVAAFLAAACMQSFAVTAFPDVTELVGLSSRGVSAVSEDAAGDAAGGAGSGRQLLGAKQYKQVHHGNSSGSGSAAAAHRNGTASIGLHSSTNSTKAANGTAAPRSKAAGSAIKSPAASNSTLAASNRPKIAAPQLGAANATKTSNNSKPANR